MDCSTTYSSYANTKPTQAWLILAIASLFYLYEFLHRIIPCIMAHEITNDFVITATEMGTVSACYYIAYAVMQIPAGILLDRFGSHNLLSLAALIVSIGSLLFATTTSLELARLSRILIGLGSAFSFIGCLRLGAIWFPTNHTGLIIGLTNLVGVVGITLSGYSIAVCVNLLNWRNTMIFISVLGFILTGLLWHFVYDKNDNYRKTIPYDLSFWQILKDIFSNPQIFIIALFGGLMVAPIISYSELWGIIYLITNYEINKPLATQIITSTFLGIALGGPSIGWLSDRINKRKLLMLIGCISALIVMTVILYIPVKLFILILLHILFGGFSSSMLLCFSLNARHTKKATYGFTIGLTNSIIVFTSVILQPIIGKILDLLATNNVVWLTTLSAANYKLAFLSLIACHVMALFLIAFIRDEK